jgi:ABC-type lipoprotein export system ATPase subunit
MADELVRVDGVSRRFQTRGGAVDAVTKVSCVINRGERIAVVGASGSGKSTLLALFAKLDEPSEGSITWPGFPEGQTLRPRHIGVAFQTQSLLPSLTAAENVEVPLLIAGETKDNRVRVAEALESVGLSHVADRLPEELSGGQAQRVGAARAIVTSPRLLLADEPTGQLDQVAAQHLIDMLLAWAERTGAALVVATHDQQVARRFKTVWHMSHGRLEQGHALRAVS